MFIIVALVLFGLILWGPALFAGFAAGRATAPKAVGAPAGGMGGNPGHVYMGFPQVNNPQAFGRAMQAKAANKPGLLGRLGGMVSRMLLSKAAMLALGAAGGYFVVPLVLEGIENATEAIAEMKEWAEEWWGAGVEFYTDVTALPAEWQQFWEDVKFGPDGLPIISDIAAIPETVQQGMAENAAAVKQHGVIGAGVQMSPIPQERFAVTNS